jgi:hypothetical protein
VSLIKKARIKGYKITLLYFWLNSPDFAKQRVAKRVSKGGHNIPDEVVERRYYRGISNLLNLYIPIVDNWTVIDNMQEPNIIARGSTKGDNTILNSELWNIFSTQRNFMEEKNIYLDEYSEKVLEGLKKAFKKLVETSAKLDEELVIRDRKDGKVKSVPAKDLLHLVQK